MANKFDKRLKKNLPLSVIFPTNVITDLNQPWRVIGFFPPQIFFITIKIENYFIRYV